MRGPQNQSNLVVLAPIDGQIVPLEQVPDEVFAQKLVGDGLAIDPRGSVAVAPISGRLVRLFPGGHAFVIAAGPEGSDEESAVIVHLGLDTVELAGDGFTLLAQEGDRVEAGAPVVGFDRARIAARGKSMLSPVVFSGNGTLTRRASGRVQAGRDVLFVVQRSL
ncbi:PTS sugar transporter subunit IIA [Thermogemmatispora tikiterensis]|uniref:PTS N-acetylmuramic acid transporter subunit IIBC n=1 Tax=Thermogemmatispora tikiterensis TaxID=1825093 RepID=A0A328VWF4_9CHLR|nr:PTS glucose transporter subunit IIA [Thermogemmatispora tikiterensis]RAQ98475.1 PTS N-acetylmuramic acid transporter subunit IIBC [Thermogemmatispora tikiterensis]